MPLTHELPKDPLARFRAIYEALNDDRSWYQTATSLRFAALAAICCPGDARYVARSIRRTAERIKTGSGWCGPLNSDVRFIVAALLHLHGDSAQAFLSEVRRVRALFREASLRREHMYETMAILILRIQAGHRPVQTSTVHRFKSIYEEMKRYHWWLTGPDDFPACALLTPRSESAALIGSTVERIYQALRREGCTAGDRLQTTANVLFLADARPSGLAERFRNLRDEFKHVGIAIWQSDYDELALLSFLPRSAHEIVDRVVDLRAEMRQLRPRPDRSMTFNLACSLGFAELAVAGADHATLQKAKVLIDMHSVVQARRAAAAAAAAG